MWRAKQVAEKIGLTDAGQEGERLSFAEQVERQQERAERRADRYEYRAASAEKRGEELQEPINRMHGDIAFFTQPIINTSAGRAFARRRERMFASFDRGFDEFRKSEYWQERAETARKTAAGAKYQDKGFLGRRISECESSIRKLKKNCEEQESIVDRLESGETVTNWRGEPISLEKAQESLDYWLDRMEVELDKLGYYQETLESLGGVLYNKNNLHKGDLVVIKRWREPVRVLRCGPKNFVYEFTLPHMTYANGTPMQGRAAYAEIVSVNEQ